MFPQHFIIEGKYYGTAQRSWDKKHALPLAPFSYAFFCDSCAELWARCPVEGIGGKPTRFQVLTKRCRKHPEEHDSFGFAGSLMLSWDESFTAAVEEAAIAWEFQRAIEQYPQQPTESMK